MLWARQEIYVVLSNVKSEILHSRKKSRHRTESGLQFASEFTIFTGKMCDKSVYLHYLHDKLKQTYQQTLLKIILVRGRSSERECWLGSRR